MKYPLLALVGITSSAFGVGNEWRPDHKPHECGAVPPAPCYHDDCKRCYCLGPENSAGNPSVGPITCNGDISITVAGFYWRADQDGMEYAIEDNEINISDKTPVDAIYKKPDFKWNLGFKLGLAYVSPCDGWDIGILWTRYQGKGASHNDVQFDFYNNFFSESSILLPIWSAFEIGAQGDNFGVSDIQTHWKLRLNLVDIGLGREFWVSKYLAFRPFIGFRLAKIDQTFEIQYTGFDITFSKNEVDIHNKYHGIGVRSGIELNWYLGCGFSIYNNLAGSIVYGRFSIDHDENNRLAISPFSKTKILETKDSFCASRAMLDIDLGIQWSSLVCDCRYGITARLGFEHHLFFHQNQMWRVDRSGSNRGENVFHQRRGTLSTRGWTLTFKFDF